MRFILLTFVLSFLFETRKKLPACPALSNPPPTTTIDRFVRINFDYVIIGEFILPNSVFDDIWTRVSRRWNRRYGVGVKVKSKWLMMLAIII